jgi:hypothetical protein
MARQIRIRAVERKDIDIDKLANALLRLARDLQKPTAVSKTKEVRDE